MLLLCEIALYGLEFHTMTTPWGHSENLVLSVLTVTDQLLTNFDICCHRYQTRHIQRWWVFFNFRSRAKLSNSLKNTLNNHTNHSFSFQLSKALKDLPNRVLNVAVDERPELFKNVIDVLSDPGKFSTFFPTTGMLSIKRKWLDNTGNLIVLNFPLNL